jgi:hypothetical protein
MRELVGDQPAAIRRMWLILASAEEYVVAEGEGAGAD